MAPDRYAYGPSSRKPVSATRPTATHGLAEDGVQASARRQKATSASPPNKTRLRPFRPRRSLRMPDTTTDAPPNSGNNAERLAAWLPVNPTYCTKYVGVQKLNVSRSSVVPSESRHTSQKGKLVSNGRRISLSGSGRSSFSSSSPAYTFSGFASGDGRPRSRGVSRRKIQFNANSTDSPAAPTRKIPRQPMP